MNILLLNGPNLNLLGTREPERYGSVPLEQIVADLRARFADHRLDHLQSNHEGVLIDRLHAALHDGTQGVVINAGALSHTSRALADALVAIRLPAIEVHLTNIYAREQWRRHSVLSEACRAVICGLGPEGYALAVQALVG